MAKNVLLKTFTSDEEINCWILDDDSIELRGYVDQIDGSRMESPSAPLYKITLNNGSKARVRVLLWGNFATKYSKLICDRSVVTIIREKTILQNKKYCNPNEKICSMEVTTTGATEILIDSEKFEDIPIDKSKAPAIKLENALDTVGPMIVEGFIKQPPKMVRTYGESYGLALIVNETYKLRLKIMNFVEKSDIVKGCHVQVLCTVDDASQGVPSLIVRSTDDITLVLGDNPLTEVKLRSIGFVTPKRKADKTFEESDIKRMALD